jgi:hypothetical protein
MAQDASAQQNEPKSPPKAGAQTQTGTSAQTKSARTAELEARSYKGTLLDASCAMSAVSEGTQKAPDGNKSKERKSEASPSANNAGQSCSISTHTSQFALKLDDGQTVRFDSVGNVRAQEAIKDNKKMDRSCRFWEINSNKSYRLNDE